MVIFNRGRVEQQGTPNEIIKTPRTPFIMKFVGETNMVPATAQVRGPLGEQAWLSPPGALRVAFPLRALRASR